MRNAASLGPAAEEKPELASLFAVDSRRADAIRGRNGVACGATMENSYGPIEMENA